MLGRQANDLLSDTGGVDQNINVAVVLDNVIDGLGDSTAVTDIDLVEANIDASLLGKLTSSPVAELLLHIHDGNTTDADLSESLSHVETKTTATTIGTVSYFLVALLDKCNLPSDDGNLAGESELLKSRGEAADQGAIKAKSPLLDILTRRADRAGCGLCIGVDGEFDLLLLTTSVCDDWDLVGLDDLGVLLLGDGCEGAADDGGSTRSDKGTLSSGAAEYGAGKHCCFVCVCGVCKGGYMCPKVKRDHFTK